MLLKHLTELNAFITFPQASGPPPPPHPPCPQAPAGSAHAGPRRWHQAVLTRKRRNIEAAGAGSGRGSVFRVASAWRARVPPSPTAPRRTGRRRGARARWAGPGIGPSPSSWTRTRPTLGGYWRRLLATVGGVADAGALAVGERPGLGLGLESESREASREAPWDRGVPPARETRAGSRLFSGQDPPALASESATRATT